MNKTIKMELNNGEELNDSMEGQQFCLRWHNFQNTLLSSLPKLLDGGYLTDVTLSAGGRHIRAHRIILSACSYYFKELFKDLSAMQHPVIVLPGMEYANLCALVTFMYNGEVNIYQEQLPALLAMADTLHIRGLADIAGKNVNHDNGLFIQPSGTSEETDMMNDTTIKEETSYESAVKSEIIDSVSHQSQNSTIVDNSNPLIDDDEIPFSVKTKPYYSINAKLAQKEKKQNSGNISLIGGGKEKSMDKNDETLINDKRNILLDDNKSNISMIDTNFRFLSTSSSSSSPSLSSSLLTGKNNQTCNKTSVTCLICGKQLSNQYNLRVHMETHSNSSYSCSACSHVSRSRDALRKHVSYRHPVATPQKRPRYSISKP